MLFGNRFFAGLVFMRAPDDEGGAGGTKEPAAAAPAAPAGDAPAAPAAAGEPPATTPAAGDPPAPAGTPPTTPPAPGAPAAGTPPAAAPPGTSGDNEPKIEWPKDGFPDDWKDRFVKGLPEEQQAKVKQVVDKYASPYEAMRALTAADSKISEQGEKLKGAIKPLGKDATPADIEAFDKAMGVPAEPDKYEIKRPDDVAATLTDVDKVADGIAKKVFKDLHLNQTQVDGLVKLELDRAALGANERTKMTERAIEESQNDLRIHFGVKEYEPQIAACNRYVDEVMAPIFGSKEAAYEWLGVRDPVKGVARGENPAFVKWLAQTIVNPWMDDNGHPRGAGGQTTDLDTRLKELQGLQVTDVKRYGTKDVQDEIDRLITSLSRRSKAA